MSTLIQVAHDLKSNTLEAVWFDSEDKQNCRNFSPIQIDEFKEATGEFAQRYIDLAGWTPEYIAAVKKKEEDEAAEKQAKADVEEAERKAQKAKEDKDAFDAEVARQVKILEAAQAIVSKKK